MKRTAEQYPRVTPGTIATKNAKAYLNTAPLSEIEKGAAALFDQAYGRKRKTNRSRYQLSH